MAAIHITDIESAINWWRERTPSPDGITACAEVRALAEVYALMVYYHEHECDEDSMPPRAARGLARLVREHARRALHRDLLDRQGDAVCKGCGRTVDEVQHWPAMTPAEKRSVWRRITLRGHRLALQPLRRTRAPRSASRRRTIRSAGRRRRPPSACR